MSNVTSRACLVVNLGSASKCYVLYREATECAYAYFLRISPENYMVEYRIGSRFEASRAITRDDFVQSARVFVEYLKSVSCVHDIRDIDVVAFRVVAPGSFFVKHQKLDANYRQKLGTAARLDPLHIIALCGEIDAVEKLLPQAECYAISDSEFYKNMPDCAKLYALSREFAQKHDIYRFGYHGIACAAILRKCAQMCPTLPKRIIVCHLGGGSSIAAIKDGAAIDTSMGFSPLEGLAMTTRVGSIDPAAILSLVGVGEYGSDNLIAYLYEKCGLFGLSGGTENMRQLIKKAQEGDADCAFALDYYFYAIQKCIGGYVAALGGLDLLVLAGGMAENIPVMRSRVCQRLDFIALKLDEELNEKVIAQDAFIQDKRSYIKIATMTCDESLEMINIFMNMINCDES